MAALDKYPSGMNEIVRKKNLNLSIGEFNLGSTRINSNTLLMTKDQEYKKVAKQRESIVARLDLDKGTQKSGNDYITDLGDTTQINSLTGKGKQKDILRDKHIERGQPKQVNKTKILIEKNPISLSVKSYKLEKAIKNTKNYKHNKVINSCPIKKI